MIASHKKTTKSQNLVNVNVAATTWPFALRQSNSDTAITNTFWCVTNSRTFWPTLALLLLQAISLWWRRTTPRASSIMSWPRCVTLQGHGWRKCRHPHRLWCDHRVNISTYGHENDCASSYVNIWTSGRRNIWTFCRVNTWAYGRVRTQTLLGHVSTDKRTDKTKRRRICSHSLLVQWPHPVFSSSPHLADFNSKSHVLRFRLLGFRNHFSMNKY